MEQSGNLPTDNASNAPAPHTAPPTRSNTTSGVTGVELLLSQLIVRYGEKIICEAEDENGETIPLSVTEFIFASLTQDDLSFSTPTAQTILSKAMKHIHDEGFIAEKYFLGHRDMQLSQIAFQL